MRLKIKRNIKLSRSVSASLRACVRFPTSGTPRRGRDEKSHRSRWVGMRVKDRRAPITGSDSLAVTIRLRCISGSDKETKGAHAFKWQLKFIEIFLTLWCYKKWRRLNNYFVERKRKSSTEVLLQMTFRYSFVRRVNGVTQTSPPVSPKKAIQLFARKFKAKFSEEDMLQDLVHKSNLFVNRKSKHTYSQWGRDAKDRIPFSSEIYLGPGKSEF